MFLLILGWGNLLNIVATALLYNMVQDIDIAPRIDDNEVIWRYMDFASFYSLLYTKGLFFRRIDKYTDAYEGTLPNEVYDFLINYFDNIQSLLRSTKSGKESADSFSANLKELNTGTLSNSWVATSKEIYAMWKIYLRGSTEGVAIRSTVGRLREVLNSGTTDFTLAKVSYDILSWPQTDYTTLAAYKSKPYTYECELRALVYNQFSEETKPIKVFPKVPLYEHGATFPITVDRLIEKVYISPFAGAWFYDVVKTAIQTHLPSFDLKDVISSGIKDR